MGAWDTSILGNDTSAEVRDRFIALYDLGENPVKIAGHILTEQKETFAYDNSNAWLGLALACWECGVLTKKILAEVKRIIRTKEDIAFNRSLDADANFLKKRQQVLDHFIEKISTEKATIRKRKKVPVPSASVYVAGMCLSYKNRKGKYIGIYLTVSEHFKNKGKIEFFFLDFESGKLPNLDMFANSKLYGLKKLGKEWGNYKYGGNVSELAYEKNTKDNFFRYVPNLLILVGTLQAPDSNKLINSLEADHRYTQNPKKIIDSLENVRLEGKQNLKPSAITLKELLIKIGL